MPSYRSKGVHNSYQEIYRNSSYRHNGNINRDWRQTNDVSRRVSPTSKPSRTRWGLIGFAVLTLLCIIVIIIVLVSHRTPDNPGGDVTECPPGFTEQNCQSTSFIGSSIWSEAKAYKLADGQYYSNGIAFRVYAPQADAIDVITSISSSDTRRTPMQKQENGFWFANVGGVGIGCQFAYSITRNDNREMHLIQNGQHLVQLEDDSWRNVQEESTSSVRRSHQHNLLRQTRFSSYEVMYTIHLPSFSNSGNYSGIYPYLQYLREWGVTTIRFLTLDPHSCEGSSIIDSQCWYHPNIVYPGIPHPSYGSQHDLYELIQAILRAGMSVVIDMDLTKFTTSSDWYNYDGSATSSSFGSLFDNTPLFTYDSRVCAKPILQSNTPTRSIIMSMLRRYSNEFGFKGFYWKGILCLRLDSELCEQGKGSDNMNAITFLRSLYNEGWTLYGEDKNGIVEVENPSSAIQDIVEGTSNRGLAFDGQLDLSVGDSLKAIIFKSTISGNELISYFQSVSTRKQNHIITLETPDIALEKGRLYSQSFTLDQDPVKTIQRLNLLSTFFSFTPGILQVFMGDEYFTELPFQKNPSALDIASALPGGSHNGIYNFTKSLLDFRLTKKLYDVYNPSVYFTTSSFDVFAFLLKSSQTRIVGIVNCNSHPVKEMEIDLPNIPGDKYEWQYVINTDSSKIYQGITDYNQEIILGSCIDRHVYDTCVNITMGAYSVKILEIGAKNLF